MKRDPVRTNLLENSGGYLWQVADRVVGSEIATTSPGLLRKPCLPTINDGMTAWQTYLSPSTRIRWANDVRLRDACETPLLSPRGVPVTIAVNTISSSCVEVTSEASEALQSGTEMATLPRLTAYGAGRNSSDLIIALVRHGLISVSEDIRTTAWGLLREPFIKVSEGEQGAVIVTNQLNGRFLQVSPTTAELIDALSTPSPILEPLSAPLRILVDAGVLRIIGGPK